MKETIKKTMRDHAAGMTRIPMDLRRNEEVGEGDATAPEVGEGDATAPEVG